MKNRPLPVMVVSLLFILAGGVGFVYHVSDIFKPGGLSYAFILIQFLSILAVACGILLLFRMNRARWLALAWMAYHVIISAFNSISEMIAHFVFLIIISVLLFLPASSAYFQRKNKQ